MRRKYTDPRQEGKEYPVGGTHIFLDTLFPGFRLDPVDNACWNERIQLFSIGVSIGAT